MTRSTTLDAPVSTAATLAEIAAELVGKALADYPAKRSISLLASARVAAGGAPGPPPLVLCGATRRPGTRQGIARDLADAAIDRIRRRFGWEAVGYAAAGLAPRRAVPDAFRELAEKDL